MTQSNSTPVKQRVLTILKWVFAVFFFIMALAMFKDKAYFSILFLALGGILLFPPLSNFWNSKLPFLNNKFIKAGLLIALFIGGFALNPNVSKNKSSIGTTENKDQLGKEDKKINPYQNYIDKVAKNISALTTERKVQREKMYNELKANSVYKLLVDSTLVSMEYMPCLNAISNGISYTTTDGFSINETIANQIDNSKNGKEKFKFSTLIIALAGNSNGGVPSEIIDVFLRYKDKFNLYNERGVFIDAEGKETKIEYDYDITPFFAMIDPKNTDILNKVYEAKQKGLSQWSNTKNATYPYLATKEGYMDYIKVVSPESPYILKVDFELTASELYNAYDANEVSADEKYKGKKIAITGRISNIGKDILDDPYVSLQIDYLQSVNCYFSDENNKVISQLSKGQKVTIIGICKGLTITDVVIQDCELLE